MEYNQLTENEQNAIDQWQNNNNFYESYDCADNFRYAHEDNKEELDLYYTKQGNGCCGFVDVEFEVDGRTLLYGFNYGH